MRIKNCTTVYIFWATIGAPIVLEGWTHSAWSGWSFVAGMYGGAMIPATAGLIVLFGTVGYLKPDTRRWVGLGRAGLLAAIGIYQVVSGAAGCCGACRFKCGRDRNAGSGGLRL